MKTQHVFLGITICSYFFLGGLIDYWQSARHHHKLLPAWLSSYFALFWLVLYNGLLPFLLVFLASNFNLYIAKTYLGFALIGYIVWDIVYSLLDSHKLVSYQKDYWFWKKKRLSANS